MKKLYYVIQYNLGIYLKTKRFWASLILTVGILILGLSTYLKPGTDLPSSVSEYYLAPVSVLVLLISILGAIFGGDIISSDKEMGNAYFLYSLPISFRKLFFGKFISSLIAISGIIIIYYMIIFLISILCYGHSSLILGESILLALLYSVAWISFSSFIGSFFRKTSSSLISAILMNFFVMNTLGSVIAKATNWPVWFILNYVSYPCWAIFKESYPTTTSVTTSLGPVTIEIPTLMESLVIMVIYIGTFLVGSYIVYKKKEV